jgi:hypothetical protein
LGQWKPGQQGDDRGSRGGSKPGVKRGPYKTKRSQAELHEFIEQQKNPMAAKPDIKLVKDEGRYIDTKEYLKSVVATDTLPHRDRTTAALGLMPFEYPKAEGRYLGFQWDEPAPKTLDQAIIQSQKIIELERQGVINNVDATTLHDRISRIAQLMGWADLAKRVEALEARDAARQEAGDASGVQVVVVDGMPTMPGTGQVKLPGCMNEAGEYVISGVAQQGEGAREEPAPADRADTDAGRDDQG